MHERYYEIFERFKRHFPSEKDNIADWYPSTRNEIVVRFKNGEAMYFSGNQDRFGYINKWDVNEDGEYSRHELSDEELRYKFSFKLRRLMQSRYMNQTELSKATGISAISISHYMNGRTLPDYKNLLRIANVLTCSVSELMYFDC